ncbi:MAG: mechanosensitive ion channel [Proteobacteria bacterium]|nr:mechanosensitive ion channel [Pseudomonadota bacterium]
MEKNDFIKSLVLLFAVLGLMGPYGSVRAESSDGIEEIHLAVVGPMETEDSVGTAFVRAAGLFLDDYNRSADERGYKIVLDVYDDGNDTETAAIKAEEIAKNERILGVIGHYYSSVSIVGGEIYRKYEIPAISPSSTSVEVTQDNPWYFRTVFDNQYQGEFLANYAKAVMKRNHAVIIHEDLHYGLNLARVFEETGRKNGLNISHKYAFRDESENLDRDFEHLVEQIVSSKSNDLIFIASHHQKGIKLVKQLRDAGLTNQILTPNAFAHPAFSAGFNVFPKENGKPGYYSNDIYVAVPLLYESADTRARHFYRDYLEKYGVEPGWRAAFARDAVMLFAVAIENTAIEKTGAGKTSRSVKAKRTAIRDYLGKMTSASRGIGGASGLNYFDDQGSSLKPISIGQYKNRILIPALTQLKPISNIEDIPDLEQALKDETVIKVGSDYMYKVDIVYTGVNINGIKDIDMEEFAHTMDFDIWFRYRGDSNVGDIEFLNAVKPVQLRLPLEEIRLKGQLYRRYHVVGRFRTDFLTPSGVGRHVMGVSFAHKSSTRNNVIFVPDKIGGNPLLSRLTREDRMILNPGSSWIVDRMWSFQDIFPRKIKGNVKYLNEISKRVDYTQFVSAVEVKKDILSIRNSFSSMRTAYLLLGLSLFLILLFGEKPRLVNRGYCFFADGIIRKRRQKIDRNIDKVHFSYNIPEDEVIELPEYIPQRRIVSAKLGWFVYSFALLTALFSLEIPVMRLAFARVSPNAMPMIVLLFDILWWVAPAHIVSLAVKTFVWSFLEEKSGHHIPSFLKSFVTFVIYLVMFFGILAFVYDLKITSILGTSGIFVMIIGLAVQMNISNVFAGLVLNTERSIKVNDWVKIGNVAEGKVIETNWRTITIRTGIGTVINVPNNTISDSEFQNFTSPVKDVLNLLRVDLEKDVPYDKVVKTAKEAMGAVEEVLDSPGPDVRFDLFTHWSARYVLSYRIVDYTKRFAIRKKIWENLIKAFNREKIKSASMSLSVDNEGMIEA